MNRRGFLAASVGAMAAPRAAGAQHPGKVRRLALLATGVSLAEMSGSGLPYWRAFFEELRRLGYREGQNLAVERRTDEGDARRLPELAREIAELRPEVICTISNRAAAALKAATTTIPIVAIVGDPVGFGFAKSLARPGGNITGFSIDPGLAVFGRFIGLLKEMVPTASRIAYLTARVFWEGRVGAIWREAARHAGLTSVDAAFDYPADEAEFRRVFAGMARDRVELLDVGPTPETNKHRELIAKLAAENRLPAIYALRDNVEAGGFMAHAIDLIDMWRRSAGHVDLILRGANAAEMPFQQPTKFELIINLKAAKALGLTVPEAILARADVVIE
jgi:putative ABC transport system substrate-binding protein